jgi:hypothetical protein
VKAHGDHAAAALDGGRLQRLPRVAEHDALVKYLSVFFAQPFVVGVRQVDVVADVRVLVFRPRADDVARAIDPDPPLRQRADRAAARAGGLRMLLRQQHRMLVVWPVSGGRSWL